MRRVARLADGWLASAYNTTPDGFRDARDRLGSMLRARGGDPARFPNALATMWTYVSEDQAETQRVLRDIIAPAIRRPVAELEERLLVGTPERCAALLSAYADAGVQRALVWPVLDESRQLALLAQHVMPAIAR